MKKKTLCSVVAVAILTVMVGSSAFAFAEATAHSRAANTCPNCNSSAALTYYNINNNSYHRVRCDICEKYFYDGHTINNYTTRECVKCGDVVGD